MPDKNVIGASPDRLSPEQAGEAILGLVEYIAKRVAKRIQGQERAPAGGAETCGRDGESAVESCDLLQEHEMHSDKNVDQ